MVPGLPLFSPVLLWPASFNRHWFAGSLLMSLGQGRRYLQCGIFNTVILSASFVVGLPVGRIGVALAYAIGNYIVLYPWLWWAFRGSPVSFL